MTNEKWWANASYLKNGSYDFDKIVAEAMRRGEVKAWEEARELVIELREYAESRNLKGMGQQGMIINEAEDSGYEDVLYSLDEKLTSLKTP